jgi:hypothetical protein
MKSCFVNKPDKQEENAKTLGFWRVVFVPDPSTYPSTLTGRCRAAEH